MIAGLHIRGLPAGTFVEKTALRQRAVSRQIRFTNAHSSSSGLSMAGRESSNNRCMDVQVPSAPAARRPVLQSAEIHHRHPIAHMTYHRDIV